MARAKKKSMTQHAVGLALAGMPAPIRNVAASRKGAPLVLLAAGLLIASGALTINWSNGRPAVAVNPQRASQVRQKVEERLGDVGQRLGGETGEAHLRAVLDKLARQVGTSTVPAGSTPVTPGADAGWETATAANPTPNEPGAGFPTAVRPVSRSPHTITIASFNIQVFGTSKLAKPSAMHILADIVRRFDVVAIQEVRAIDDTVLPQFVAMINSSGAAYDFLIGPRLGRTTSKEQYAVVYDTARIEIDPRCVYTVPDPQDLLHREPMVARFRVRGVPPEQAFTFSLVNIHTDPDETDTELDALAPVFVGVQQNGTGEDDVILLGDLNVDEKNLGKLGQLPAITHVIAGVPTNTRGTKTYDNLLFDSRATVEFTGRAGVLNMISEYGLTPEQALEISDHLPIWAEFGVYEGWNGSLAVRQPDSIRR